MSVTEIPLNFHKSAKPDDGVFPVLRRGFRPFYLLAAIWLVIAMPVWLMMYGHGADTASHLQFVDWHVHEMMFGFAGAVIVGFLFTAVQNWTGQKTPESWSLAALALIWCVARVLLLSSWSRIGIVFDVGFYVIAAIGIARPIWRTRQSRNYLFVFVLMLLGLLDFAHHALALTWLKVDSTQIYWMSLDAILLIVSVVTGRVIPMFTNNALGVAVAKRNEGLERLIVPAGVLLLLVDAVQNAIVLTVVVILLAAMHMLRWLGWFPHKTLKHPMLWILHASYAWLIVGLLLRASAIFYPLSNLLAMHAFTVGVIAGLCMGMMCRTARGHTGRPIQASRTEVGAFALVGLAAVVRVLMPLLLPSFYGIWVLVSGLTLTTAYLLYIIVFAPWLLSARADGAAG